MWSTSHYCQVHLLGAGLHLGVQRYGEPSHRPPSPPQPSQSHQRGLTSWQLQGSSTPLKQPLHVLVHVNQGLSRSFLEEPVPVGSAILIPPAGLDWEQERCFSASSAVRLLWQHSHIQPLKENKPPSPCSGAWVWFIFAFPSGKHTTAQWLSLRRGEVALGTPGLFQGPSPAALRVLC